MSKKSALTKTADKLEGKHRKFRRPEFVDIVIEGLDDKVHGTLRVEPNRIMWAPKETKKWRRVPLDAFTDWITSKESGSELVEK